MRVLGNALFAAVLTFPALAQAPLGQLAPRDQSAPRDKAAARPEFAAVAIEMADSAPGAQINAGLHVQGAHVRAQALTLRDYIGIAYRVKTVRIAGPDWISTQRYDIDGTIPPGVSASSVPEIFQALLAARFHLQVHHETKEFPVYGLVAAQGPVKPRETPPGAGNGSSWVLTPNRFEASKVTMQEVAADLERFSSRPVVDMTGLKGRYDLSFEIDPAEYRALLIRSAISGGAVLPEETLRQLDESSPSALADAVAQTGLKLEPRTAALDAIVVDGALRTPAGN